MMQGANDLSHYRTGRSRRAAGGFSVIEVLLSVFLGLMATAILIQVFSTSQRAVRNQRALSHLQETGRFSAEFLDRSLRLAGYSSLTDSLVGISGDDAGDVDPCGLGSTSFETVDIPPMGTKKDKTAVTLNASAGCLAIEYRGGTNAGENIIDCLGNPVSDAHIATNIFAVNSDNELICSVTRRDDDLNYYDLGGNLITPVDGVTSQPDPVLVARGIEVMQVRYGIETETACADADGVANRYVDAATIDVPDDDTAWDDVVSVRVALLISAPDMAADDMCIACGTDFDSLDVDGMRGEFTTTIGLRNRMIKRRNGDECI